MHTWRGGWWLSVVVGAILLNTVVKGDHYEGGAIKWYTKANNTVVMVIRQLWDTGSVTTARSSRIFWGDGGRTDINEAFPEDCYNLQGEARIGYGACVEGSFLLSSGELIEVTEAWVEHTYPGPGTYYGRKMEADTRSISPGNVGGGIGRNVFTIKVNGNESIVSPYFSGFRPGVVDDLIIRIPRTPPGIVASAAPGSLFPLPVTVLEWTSCRLYTASEADIRADPQGPSVVPHLVQTIEGEVLVLTSNCYVRWDTSNTPRNSHWTVPGLLTSLNDSYVQSWFEVPVDIDDRSVFCYVEGNDDFPLTAITEVQETFSTTSYFLANSGLTYYPYPPHNLYFTPYEVPPNITYSVPPGIGPWDSNPMNVTVIWIAPPLHLGPTGVFLKFSTVGGGDEFSYICGYYAEVIERECSVTFLNDALGGIDGLFQVQCSLEEEQLFGIPVKK